MSYRTYELFHGHLTRKELCELIYHLEQEAKIPITTCKHGVAPHLCPLCTFEEMGENIKP